MNEQDQLHMRTAIAASRQARERGDMPFGAVLAAPDGRALMTAMNNQVTTRDCTGHAELVLVREAQRTLGDAALAGATVYASGEPCAMCSGAMFWAGITRVVYAASTPEIDAALGGASLGARCADVLARAAPVVSVEGPLLGAEAVAVLQDKG
ncbi:nucleoside deaminase [Paucibacter sp. R3-3]|uniref:Nucleoside deaminase n=1 Tax=Roseateles agri TaxID=3098619 RepID=A0ABU5DFC8_9BURK|nr:nucleoside deaminase [Paucibacter sp. R3-3]MDY0744988.1 nucleoside deaminase [Paucibacter sp. R3-3]